MQLDIFDYIEDNNFKKRKSDDWKWTMKDDYPQKNGLKVFSCFACGGVQQWVINCLVLMLLVAVK